MANTLRKKLVPIIKPFHKTYLRTRQSIVGNTIRPINYFHAFSRQSMLTLFVPKEIRTLPSDPRAEELRSNGYVTLPNFYDPQLIRDVQKDFDRAMRDDALTDKQKFSKTLKSSMDFAHHIPGFLKLLRHPEFLSIMHSYYKSYFSLQLVSGTRLYPIPEEDRTPDNLISANWHCDDIAADLIHLVVYLHDVTPDHGPTAFISKQRTADLMKMGFYRRNETTLPKEVMEDPNHVKQLTSKIGTAHLMRSPVLLHRAGIPSAGFTRDSFFFSFRPGMETVQTANFTPVKKKLFDLLYAFSDDWRNPLSPSFKNRTYIYGESR